MYPVAIHVKREFGSLRYVPFLDTFPEEHSGHTGWLYRTRFARKELYVTEIEFLPSLPDDTVCYLPVNKIIERGVIASEPYAEPFLRHECYIHNQISKHYDNNRKWDVQQSRTAQNINGNLTGSPVKLRPPRLMTEINGGSSSEGKVLSIIQLLDNPVAG